MRTNDKGGWLIVKPKAIVGLQLKISNQQTFNSLDVGILFMFVCVHSNRETRAPARISRGRAKR